LIFRLGTSPAAWQ